MATLYLSGEGVSWLNWGLPPNGLYLYPFIGGGIGGTRCALFDFRSTGLTGGDGPTFNSENQYSTDYRLTYQILGGLELKQIGSWAISCGYRFFDIGSLKSSRYFRDATGAAFDTGNAGRWSIPFSANEVFLELKLFL